MIVDGKYIEEGSIPLNRLEVQPMTAGDAAQAHTELNNRISNIENLSAPSNSNLMQFKADMDTHVGSTISASAETPHIIGDNYITKAMLNSDLAGDIVYRTGTDQEITSVKHFKGVTTQFSANSSTAAAINVTSGKTVLQDVEAKAGTFAGALTTTGTSSNLTIAGTGSNKIAGNLEIGASGATKKLKVFGDLEVTGNVILNSVVNATTTNTEITDQVILLNKGGTSAVNAGIEINCNSTYNPQLVYSGSSTGSGWAVRKAGSSNTFKQLATVDDITAAGGQTATQVATAIKNAILTEVKKVILAGKGVNYTTTTATTLQGTAGRAITLPAGFASAAGDYAVFISVDGTSAPATVGNIGEIYVVNNSATKFTVYNSGSNAAATFTWVAINLTKWKAYGGANVF